MAHSVLRRSGAPDALKEMVSEALDQNWRVERTGSGHLRFLSPDRSVSPVFSPTTPSDVRSVKNVRGKLRRAGLNI
ncbi:MAG: hypothetical protein R3346_02575 [Candidatus Spechtbacterales bacterium]|nr:hypothetical protein [Candidatus Spechtbacterales bacterium]